MSEKIIADSCCDLNQEIRDKLNVSIVPLSILINNKSYTDDESINTKELLYDMKKSKKIPKTACPSPQKFIDKFNNDESQFVVTVSSQISGSYKSALVAKEMFLEDVSNKFIHVFDSLSASIGETLVCNKIHEYISKELQDCEIVEKINSYIKNMQTFFLLESLDTLIKAGRINPLIAKVASVFSIRPIMAAADDGSIKLHEKVRGTKKSFKRLVEIIGETGSNFEEKILGIAHCNCLEKAQELKQKIQDKYNFKDIIIVETGGVTTIYANEGGIVIAF